MDLFVQEYVKQMVNRYYDCTSAIFFVLIRHFYLLTCGFLKRIELFCLCPQVAIKYLGKSVCDELITIVSELILEILQKSQYNNNHFIVMLEPNIS